FFPVWDSSDKIQGNSNRRSHPTKSLFLVAKKRSVRELSRRQEAQTGPAVRIPSPPATRQCEPPVSFASCADRRYAAAGRIALRGEHRAGFVASALFDNAEAFLARAAACWNRAGGKSRGCNA